MKYLITTFLLLFTINSSLSNETFEWQAKDSVGTCTNMYYYDLGEYCRSTHGECVELTVNCNYAKVVEREVDDLDKPIFETIDKPCEGDEVQNLVEVCSETILKGYEKKTIYVTEIDGAKKLAHDAQVIQARRLQLQKDKAECGNEVVKMADSIFIDDNNIDPAKQDLTLERTKEIRQDLKDGILDRALRFANNVEIEGTLLSSYQKQYLISKIEECIVKFQ